jgi:hypothetical protein
MTRLASLPNKGRAERVKKHKNSGRFSLIISSVNVEQTGQFAPALMKYDSGSRSNWTVCSTFSLFQGVVRDGKDLFPPQLLSFCQIDHDIPVEANEFAQRFSRILS